MPLSRKEYLAAAYYNNGLSRAKIDGDRLSVLVENWQQNHGLEPDGKMGPITRQSIDDAIPRETLPRTWTPWDGPESRQPCNRREVYEMFGNPGVSGVMDKRWFRENVIECHPKHGNQFPGVSPRAYIHVHRIVEPYAREALRRAQISRPDYDLDRVGSHNHRHIRHDTSRPLSIHAFAAALDINPHLNRGVTFRRGTAPAAWSDEWMKIWPDGVPRGVVEAFQSCGFAWGSDWDEDGDTTDHTYIDPMHFEWVARDGISSLV